MPNYTDNLPPALSETVLTETMPSQSCWHCQGAFEARLPGLCWECFQKWSRWEIELTPAQRAEMGKRLREEFTSRLSGRKTRGRRK